MDIKILGTESLGVRGLSCKVQVKDRKIIIDPGLSLGYRRHGLLPHPVQVAVGEQVRREIMNALQEATDIVLSHFHGDHIPLPDANPYQLNAHRVAPLFQTVRLWSRGPDGLSHHMASRREALTDIFGRSLPNAEGQKDGQLEFSCPVPHGDPDESCATVMMTRIEDEEDVFVHASDIQLLDEQAVSLILDWRPTITLVSGPPLYLSSLMKMQRRQEVWKQAIRLAHGVKTLIIDHHLLRCKEGLVWLDNLSSKTNHRVICAANFMEQPCRLLEARRTKLYNEMPVPEDWHDAYTRGETDTQQYRNDTKK
ncbi:MAG: hypothetical protein PVG14_01805 [Anaerolineales bacterium]|jgi:predicted metallo-beta-lactamase superfamily hydrolase